MNANSKPLIISVALAVSVSLAACVTAPPDNTLADAGAAVSNATASPEVARYDALDLANAQKQLANAESAAQRGAPEMADHEANLALRTARLAQTRADQAVAQLDTRARDNTVGVAPAPRTVMLVLTDDYFEPGRAQLMPDAGKIVDDLAQFLIAHPERRVRVEGHGDSADVPGSEVGLPMQRAEAVRMALVARGVDPGRSEAVTYGPADPLTASDNPADRHFIRGVEILLSDSRGQIASR
ncbi:MAG TPA: OmpA family protein [Steroidobacteraceae bacterium]|nr:OmpA family protein [Steroidobacteraceae bacterium]